MKYILQLFFSLFIFLNSTFSQHLISYQLVQHYTPQDLISIMNNLGFPQGFLIPEYSIDYYKITYSTRNAQDTGTTIATGGMAVPSGITCPVPLLSYQHGTESRRYYIPSYQGGSEYKIGMIAASLTGCVISMPDYLGMGDSPGFHPYIHAASEASATIDLLRTVRELKDSIGYNLNDQLFLFGYSQGGHSTMATFKEIETNFSSEFTVTACTPMSGPYDVSGVQAVTMTNDTPYASPGYLPYVIMGLQEAYGNIYNDLSEIFKPPYDSLLPLYFDGTNGINWINNQLPDTPNVMLDSAFLNGFLNDPNHFAWSMLKNNDLYNWAPVAPLTMYYCTADEQVFYENALVARDTMHSLGATHVDAVNLGNLDHTNCAPMCFLNSFALFEMYMDMTGGMTISSSVNDATSASSSDGTITLNADNGSGPYTYEWQDALAGQTTSTVTGLGSNTYQVQVTDARGCFIIQDINVNVSTSINLKKVENYFKLMPNPAKNIVYLQVTLPLSKTYNISIIDLNGRIIHQTLNTKLPFIRYDISLIPNGTYLVQLHHEDKVYTRKLNIQR